MPLSRRTLPLLAALQLAAAAPEAPIDGIVVTDRWGGTFLWVDGPPIYVGPALRGALFPHRGEAARVEVRQAAYPKVDPGSSAWRIDKGRLLSPPPAPPSSKASELALSVEGVSREGTTTRIAVQLSNGGSRPVRVSVAERLSGTIIAPWMQPRRKPAAVGEHVAVPPSIVALHLPAGGEQTDWTCARPESCLVYNLQRSTPLRAELAVDLEPGRYDVVIAYDAGDPLPRVTVAAFDIDQEGGAHLVPVPARETP
jgi:hypothetical protein